MAAALHLEVKEISRCSILLDLSDLPGLGLSDDLESEAAGPVGYFWVMS